MEGREGDVRRRGEREGGGNEKGETKSCEQDVMKRIDIRAAEYQIWPLTYSYTARAHDASLSQSRKCLENVCTLCRTTNPTRPHPIPSSPTLTPKISPAQPHSFPSSSVQTTPHLHLPTQEPPPTPEPSPSASISASPPSRPPQ